MKTTRSDESVHVRVFLIPTKRILFNLTVGGFALVSGLLWSSPSAAQMTGQIRVASNHSSNLCHSSVKTYSSPNTYTPGDVKTEACTVSPDWAPANVSVSSSFKADYGTIGVATSAALENTPGQTRFASVAEANALASWIDTISFAGEPGQVAYRMTAIVDISEAFAESAYLMGAGSDLLFTFGPTTAAKFACFSIGMETLGLSRPACANATTLTIGRNVITYDSLAMVGAAINVAGQLEGRSLVYGTAAFMGANQTFLDALNTAHTYFTVLTPGASLVSASGHDYTLPALGGVPEPASWAFMLAGFGMIGFNLRTRSKPIVAQKSA
jgi:hypothetical protein